MPPRQNPPSEVPPSGGVGLGPSPIGVPEGFVAERTTTHRAQPQRRPGEDFPDFVRTTTFGVAPTFFDGDQWRPATLPEEEIATWQRHLIDIDLLSEGSLQLGWWGGESASAFGQLLAYANQAGYQNPMQALAGFRRLREQFPTPEEAAPPLEIRRSNPDELRRVFRASVIDQLGEGWDSARIDKMVSAYMAQEEAVQREAYDETLAGGTVDVTQIPSPETFAQETVETEDPTGVQARRGLDAAETFFAALEGVV